ACHKPVLQTYALRYYCVNIQYFCFGGFVCQGMSHLFLNFGENTAGVFVIDLSCRADVVWR
ncbi:TPA: hypothetical protein ACJOGX_004518, partial [Enterobacter kobei]